MMNKRKITGFTLLEILLVVVIITSVVFLVLGFAQQKTDEIKRDRAVAQIQMILQAGMAYYVNKGTWPVATCGVAVDLTTLQTAGYLPTSLTTNPWGSAYTVNCDTTTPTGQTFSVITNAFNATQATILAGRLPLAAATGTQVTATVPIPGQNMNNARAANFASVYHSGSCVPVPACPRDATGTLMTPQILVVPTSVSGVNDAPPSTNVYPISSYTGFATASASSTVVPNCSGSGTSACTTDNSTAVPTGTYWRVCLAITTENGQVSPSTVAWGIQAGTVLAITRCVPATENAGSGFTVWSQ